MAISLELGKGIGEDRDSKLINQSINQILLIALYSLLALWEISCIITDLRKLTALIHSLLWLTNSY